ncbi:hypothetical protein BA171_07270 [Candidatus Hamiltonella defensa (Bemisia tabaci)]|uniref:2Fe-2S ferredoxin-type domain-containing protein n=1 Tax=Candidatus Hamiltonella defensa (Bemisia tabaci) TaxID=672795 RepID=A0A249E0D6_9ENTR|nr:hypothetical protein BA171_07270 [Candidatus Hamiltonella defensa (Bemisia tabaci)]
MSSPHEKKSELSSIPSITDTTNQVCIEFNGRCFLGNKQHVLLEQLEEQGIEIPYSCRAGICRVCQIKIIVGEVKTLTQDAMDKDGNILSCCCIPKGNLTLSD